jgi:plasmid stabilization system protein ParE
MPRAWSNKDERQYKHIRDTEERKEGRSPTVAKRIAAATVNKQRSEEGRTGRQRPR